MTITTRALYQGMSDQLVHANRMVPFASDDIAFATFDKLAEIEGLPPILTAPLTLEKAAEMAQRLMASSAELNQSGFGPSSEKVAQVKTAMAFDPMDRASYVAQYLMAKEAGIEASSVTPVGQNTPTDEPSVMTRLDNKNRAPGMYENMQNQTSLPAPGVIGREVTAAEKNATMGEFLAKLKGSLSNAGSAVSMGAGRAVGAGISGASRAVEGVRDAGSAVSGAAGRLRDGIANSGPVHFMEGLRDSARLHAGTEGRETAAFAAAQKAMAPGPAPAFSADELDHMHRWGQGAALGQGAQAAASAVGQGVRGAGSALATNPLTHMGNIYSGKDRGAAAAALGTQALGAGGALAGLGYGGLRGYQHLTGQGGEQPQPEAMDPEMLAALAGKQASVKIAAQRKLAKNFLHALRNKTGLALSLNAKVAALGLSLCGTPGLQAMDEVLGRAKTAAEADGELEDVLAVLQQQNVPVTPELLQALEAELAESEGAGPGMPPAMGAMPPVDEEQKNASIQERIQKLAEGGSLLNPPQNTPKDQPDNFTKLDNKNRPPGKYEDKGPATELNTEGGEIGAEKKAQFLAVAKTYGPHLPASASAEARAEMVQKLAALATDAERVAYVRSLFPTG